MPTRKVVYEVIDSERDYQDKKWGIHPASTGSYLVFMQDYLTEAMHQFTRQSGEIAGWQALDTIRKVTALGVACMEQNGAYYRENEPNWNINKYNEFKTKNPKYKLFDFKQYHTHWENPKMSYLSVNRQTLINDLKQCVAEIRFQKKDGSTRVMKATLQKNYLPEEYRDDPEKHSNKHYNPDVLSVWDIDANEWRSFRLDWIYSVQQLQGY